MEEKVKRVTLWLKKIYGNEPIPEYEVSAQTVDILYDLAEYTEARARDVSLLIEDTKQKAAEYDAEANYIQDILRESLDLSPSSLSSEGTSYLNVLVNSAMTLETKDTSLASFFYAINDMTSELYATESKNKEMELELSDIRKQRTAVLVLEKQLKGDLKKAEELVELENVEADHQSQNLEFLTEKSEVLKMEIQASEEQLAAMGWDQSLTHESLVSLSEELARLQQEMVPLKKKLGSYLDLTPNPSLAQVKVEEVKRELNAMEAEFSKQLDALTLEMPKASKLQFT